MHNTQRVLLSDKEIFDALAELGAGDFEHISGTLEHHLHETAKLLKAWGSDAVLQRAGLFHAAYGTAGFTASMVGLKRRSEIADLIGKDAEKIVYLYCACDRDYVWPKITSDDPIDYLDRFTGQARNLTDEESQSFCELTVANELQIAMDDPEFVKTYGKYFCDLFRKMERYLSPGAFSAVSDILRMDGACSDREMK